MTFVTFTNILLSLLCLAVVIQSARIKRSFEAIRSGDLGETVKQLDHATAQARSVLAELKQILATDGAATTRTIASGETLRDELSVMVGIGNAVAERIMDAAANASSATSEAANENREEVVEAVQAESAPVVEAEPKAAPAKAQPKASAQQGGTQMAQVQGPSTARKRSPRPSRLKRARAAAGVAANGAELQVGVA